MRVVASSICLQDQIAPQRGPRPVRLAERRVELRGLLDLPAAILERLPDLVSELVHTLHRRQCDIHVKQFQAFVTPVEPDFVAQHGAPMKSGDCGWASTRP